MVWRIFHWKEANVEEFLQALKWKCGRQTYSRMILFPRVWIDVPMPFEYVAESLIH